MARKWPVRSPSASPFEPGPWVNAAGPWVEQLAAEDPAPAEKALHLSKGVHIVLPWKALPVQHLSFFGNAGQAADLHRALPGYGFRRHDRYELRRRRPLWPEILREEATYLLEPLRRHTDAALSPEAVVGFLGWGPPPHFGARKEC